MIEAYVVGAAGMLLIEFFALLIYGIVNGGRK